MLARGTVLDGKYRVVRLIGEGGMGAVYEGQNLRIERRVAIKVMHASMTADRLLVQRFEREAQAASQIGSTYIADVLDLGDLPGGERYMVMEYLEGESLAARLKARKRMAPPEIAPIAIQLLEGLSKVHEAGILHRDLKPGNIFLARSETGQDFVKILDFGICKMRSKARGELSTGVGNLLGTVGYMCPEQLEHGPKALDHRADLYTVGVVLYRAVTSNLPYRAKNLVDLLHLMRQGRPPHVCELAPDVDTAFGKIVDKAIEWDPKARYGSAKEFQQALVDWYAKYERLDAILGDFLEKPAPAPRKPTLPPRTTAPRPQLHTEPDSIDVEIAMEPSKQEKSTAGAKRRPVTGKTAPLVRSPAKTLIDVEVEVEIDDEALTIPKHDLPRKKTSR